MCTRTPSVPEGALLPATAAAELGVPAAAPADQTIDGSWMRLANRWFQLALP